MSSTTATPPAASAEFAARTAEAAAPGTTPAAAPNPRFTQLPQAEHAKTLRAAGQGTGSQQTRVQVRDFAFVSDEPVAIGGRDQGPTPMEYLAGGVNACITVVIDQTAERRGLEITDVQTYTIAKQDTRGMAGTADVQPYMYAYRLQIVVATPVRDAVALTAFAAAAERGCPAVNLLRDANTGVRVVWSFVPERIDSAAEALSNAAWGYASDTPVPQPFHTVVDADQARAAQAATADQTAAPAGGAA